MVSKSAVALCAALFASIIGTSALAQGPSMWAIESSETASTVLYSSPGHRFSTKMGPDGAFQANADWEAGKRATWYIEYQQYGYMMILGGLLHHEPQTVDDGWKVFDWGFQHMDREGNFEGSCAGSVAGEFHSASFFIEAVAHTLLTLQQSPYAEQFQSQISRDVPLLHRAALWMIKPAVWDKSIGPNGRFTHRRYLEAAALGETSLLTGDQSLLDKAHWLISDALPRQDPSGYNPEKGGADSSYHAVGLCYAEYYMTFLPNDPLVPQMSAMADKGLKWEELRMLPSGEVSAAGNTRTGGEEKKYTGQVKHIAYTMVFRAYYWRAMQTGSHRWMDDATKVATFEHWLK